MTAEEVRQETLRRILATKWDGLTYLDLGDLPLEEIPSELGELSSLEILSLGRGEIVIAEGSVQWKWEGNRPTPRVTDLWPLSGLHALTTLNLGNCERISDLWPLSGLRALTSLSLESCESVTALSPLSGLHALNSLNLGGCWRVTDLSPLSGLRALNFLNLRGCWGVSDLSPLSGFQSLTSLNLAYSKGITDLSPLGGLQSLTSLDLQHSEGVTDLSPLQGLIALQSLDLRHSERITNLTPLKGLVALQSLKLGGCNGVTDLSPLEGLVALQSLVMWGCKRITDLSPLRGLVVLQSLDLGGCKGVTDLSPLSGLVALQFLDLRRCDWQAPFSPLRPLLAHLNKLFLANASFPDLPAELSGTEQRENSLSAVRAYYADLDAGAEADAELKVFLLGNGRVGKTQLARFLRGVAYDDTQPSTHGVRLHEHRLEGSELAHPVHLNLWDFGGQDIYHGSHALFLQGHAVFLLLWSPELETGEFEEGGLVLRNHPLTYWFDYLRTFAGITRGERRVVESPVLLIQSRCESKRDEQTPPGLPSRDEFPNLYTLSFSARTRRNQETVLESLREAIADLFARRQQSLIGTGRVRARSRLRAMQATPEAQRVRTLSRQDFHRLCEEVGHISDPDALLQFFHRAGVVFYRPGMFADQIIVDQSWALEAIYSLFHRNADLQAEFRLRDGRFTRELLDRFVWGEVRRAEGQQPFSVEEQNLFLGMMRQCHIAFPVAEKPTPEYAAPELLPPWSMAHDVRFGHLLRQNPDAEARLLYPFLHDGIARAFLAQLGTRAGELAQYWKYGCWFYDNATQSEALIRCESTPTDDRPGAGLISLRAWGPHARKLLQPLIEALQLLPFGQRPQLEPEDFFHDRPTPDEPFLIDARSEPLQSVQPGLPPRTVFLSYAHDPLPQGLLHDLLPVLRTAGITVIWDKECLREGESISQFIGSVKTMPVFLPVLSARYPRSPYCVSELFAFYETCRSDRDEFASRTVPVVLDDAGIDDSFHRAALANHWEQQLQALGPAAGRFRLDANQYALGQHMHTWQAQLANVLAILADLKFPRGADALRAEGFASILQALERAFAFSERGRRSRLP